MARFLAIQTNSDGRPCGWGVASTRQAARDEAERQWKAHGSCYQGELRGDVIVHELGEATDADRPAPSFCGVCHLELNRGEGWVVYHKAGGHQVRDKSRIVAHGACIADDVAAGRLVRVSSVAYEPTEGDGAPVEA